MPEDRNLLYQWNGVTQVANPFSHTHHWAGVHDDALTNRPASPRDTMNALDENETDLLDYLASDCGYTPLEVQNVGHTLGLTKAELAKLQEAENENRVDIDELRRRVRFAAVMCEAIIDLHATVTTPDILTASEATLRDWQISVYPEALADTWAKIDRIERTDSSGDLSKHAGHALASAELRRRLGFYWQVCKRLAVDPYSGYVKNTDLTPLEQFESENHQTPAN